MSTLVRVFLLDDHEVVRQGVRTLLEASGQIEVVGEASNAHETLSRIGACRPDVAVLDVRIPDGNGVEVCREIRSEHPHIKCLMLTSYSDDDALFEAIMAGASGYVLKQIRGSELVSAVLRVANGESLLDPAVTGKVLERLRAPAAEDERLGSLSPQERRLLELIGEGHGMHHIPAQFGWRLATIFQREMRLHSIDQPLDASQCEHCLCISIGSATTDIEVVYSKAGCLEHGVAI